MTTQTLPPFVVKDSIHIEAVGGDTHPDRATSYECAGSVLAGMWVDSILDDLLKSGEAVIVDGVAFPRCAIIEKNGRHE